MLTSVPGMIFKSYLASNDFVFAFVDQTVRFKMADKISLWHLES